MRSAGAPQVAFTSPTSGEVVDGREPEGPDHALQPIDAQQIERLLSRDEIRYLAEMTCVGGLDEDVVVVHQVGLYA